AKIAAAGTIPALAAGSTQDQINQHNKQIEDAKKAAEERVKNTFRASKDANIEKDPIERYAIATQVALTEAGWANPGVSAAEVYKAARDVEYPAGTMRDTVRAEEDTFAVSVSNACKAEMIQIEQAVKGLTPENAKEVRAIAKQTY